MQRQHMLLVCWLQSPPKVSFVTAQTCGLFPLYSILSSYAQTWALLLMFFMVFYHVRYIFTFYLQIFYFNHSGNFNMELESSYAIFM